MESMPISIQMDATGLSDAYEIMNEILTDESNVTYTEELNQYEVVHIHNKSSTYHLTRQTLLDSSLQIPNDESLTQNTYSFFYHIMSKNTDEFNKIYGSFAYISTSKYPDLKEAKLYLNVNSKALDYIIDYVQTGILTNLSNVKDAEQIIDMAIIFAMPDLVEKIRKALVF